MQDYTIWGIAGVALLLLGYNWFSNKKKDLGKFAMAIGCIGLVVAAASYGGVTDALSSGGILESSSSVNENTATQVKPILVIPAETKIYGSNSYTTATGTIKFFESGVDPTSSNSNPLDTITLSSGRGNTSAGVLESNTLYGIVYDGGSTYYDEYYNDVVSSVIPCADSDEATIAQSNSLKFYGIYAVGSIADPINEAATTGVVNGQTSAEITTSGGSKEIQVGSTGSSADDNILYYNKTNGDGQFYLDIDIGAVGANTVIKEPVLVFSDDRSNPFEGDEFSSVTVQHRTGTDFGIPSDITTYVNENGKIALGDLIEGGTTGTYRITFNMDETALTAGGDIKYMNIDDLGDYQGQDLLRNTKATASDTITIAVVA